MPAATTDRSSSASISGDGRLVAFTSDADNLVVGDGNFDTDIFVHDRPTQTTVRAGVRSDGTETGVELGSLNAALSADGQVVAFESEGALVAEDGGFPVDVFVHDEQPSPTRPPSLTPDLGPTPSRLTRRSSSLDQGGHHATSRPVPRCHPRDGRPARPGRSRPRGGPPVLDHAHRGRRGAGTGRSRRLRDGVHHLNQGQGEVCFDLSWAGIDGTVTAAHIHVGSATVAGDVVVPLFTDAALSGTDTASGCVSGVSEELIKAIRQDPENYYVNIRSDVFPAGAVRGQLGK